MVRNRLLVLIVMLCLAGSTLAAPTTFVHTRYGTTTDDKMGVYNPPLTVKHDLRNKLDDYCTILDATLKIWLSDDETDEEDSDPQVELDPEHVQIKFELAGSGTWGAWQDVDEVDSSTQLYTYILNVSELGFEDHIFKYRLRVSEAEGDAVIHRSRLSGTVTCVPVPGACLLTGLGSWAVYYLRRRRSLS